MAATGSATKPATGIDYNLRPEWKYTLQDIECSPSRGDGVSRPEEDAMRQGNIRFMNDVALAVFERAKKAGKVNGNDLRRIISTAAVLFNRFFIRMSFKQHDAKVCSTKRGGNASARTRHCNCCRSSLQWAAF